MVFPPDPIRPSEGRKEDKFVVDPIEANKRAKEGGGDWRPPEETLPLAIHGSFLFFMDWALSLISPFLHDEDEIDLPNIIPQDEHSELIESLHSLMSILQRMKDNDQSQSPQFYQQFSHTWNALLHNYQMIALHRTKQTFYIDSNTLNVLISDVDHYPPEEDHKLGFYLRKYGGEGWLPMPFREILMRLHTEHHANQENSTLNKWSELIIRILQE